MNDKIWQPLPDGEYYTWLTIDNNLIGVFVDNDYEYAYCDLPDDVRFCRLVDAPPVIPPEVAETIRSALINLRGDATRIPNYGGIDTDEVNAALAWLDRVKEG